MFGRSDDTGEDSDADEYRRSLSQLTPDRTLAVPPGEQRGSPRTEYDGDGIATGIVTYLSDAGATPVERLSAVLGYDRETLTDHLDSLERGNVVTPTDDGAVLTDQGRRGQTEYDHDVMQQVAYEGSITRNLVTYRFRRSAEHAEWLLEREVDRGRLEKSDEEPLYTPTERIVGVLFDAPLDAVVLDQAVVRGGATVPGVAESVDVDPADVADAAEYLEGQGLLLLDGDTYRVTGDGLRHSAIDFPVLAMFADRDGFHLDDRVPAGWTTYDVGSSLAKLEQVGLVDVNGTRVELTDAGRKFVDGYDVVDVDTVAV